MTYFRRYWILLILAGCTSEVPPSSRRTHELLNSVLWTQTAVEFRGLAVQSYGRAKSMLDGALADPAWTAALEQSGDFSELPPAVILDVDETVLDNSYYEARRIVNGGEFIDETWNEWCREENATPVPGALDFTRYAAGKGVAVFYVTNRRHVVEEETRRNLEALGFPLDPDSDTIYTRAERPEWEGSDKAPRRREVASRYRILLLIGDNMGDFLSGVRVSVEERASLAEKHATYWGTRWIVLPNPQYGSWEGALFGNDYAQPAEDRQRLKYEALKMGSDLTSP